MVLTAAGFPAAVKFYDLYYCVGLNDADIDADACSIIVNRNKRMREYIYNLYCCSEYIIRI